MDTSTDRQTGQTDRTDRQDRLKDTKGQKKMDISRDRQTDRQACWQTDRQTAALTRPFSDILQGLLQLLARHARTLGEGVAHRVQAGDGPVLRGP